MSEAELLLIAVGMILATGLIRCVDGLYYATISQHRYWIPQVLLWSTFIYGVNFLWGFKNDLSGNPTYLMYVSAIGVCVTFVLRARILASSNAEQIEDWADHFDKAARPYFFFAFLTSMLAIVFGIANGDSTGFDAVSIPFWIGAGLNSIGAISRKVWVRGTVAVTHLTVVMLGSYVLFSKELV